MVPMEAFFFVAHGHGPVALWAMNTGAVGASGSTAVECLCLEEGLSFSLLEGQYYEPVRTATSNLAQVVPIHQQWNNIITSLPAHFPPIFIHLVQKTHLFY